MLLTFEVSLLMTVVRRRCLPIFVDVRAAEPDLNCALALTTFGLLFMEGVHVRFTVVYGARLFIYFTCLLNFHGLSLLDRFLRLCWLFDNLRLRFWLARLSLVKNVCDARFLLFGRILNAI